MVVQTASSINKISRDLTGVRLGFASCVFRMIDILRNFPPILCKLAGRLRSDPKSLILYIKAFVKGFFYAIFFRLFKNNVTIKLPFLVYYKVRICGPGSVFIDRGCSVYPNIFDGLSIATFSEDAQVRIGKGCSLGGVTIRCHKKIVIDDRAMFANCLIQDALFSVSNPINLKIHEKNYLSPLDVHIGKKVWLAGQTIVLRGSNIADESIIATGSTCFDRDISKSHLAIGNPISRSVSVKKIEKMVEGK